MSRTRLAVYGLIAVLVALYFTPASALGLGKGPAIVDWPVAAGGAAGARTGAPGGGPGSAGGAAGGAPATVLLAGASKVNVTPYTQPAALRAANGPDPLSNDDPDWTGPVTASGLWGEPYQDENGNGRYDVGEPFTDDPAGTAADPRSAGRWDGIYLAGLDADRVATGVVDPIWVRTVVFRSGPGGPAGSGGPGASGGGGTGGTAGSGLTVAWATLDLIGVSSSWIPQIREDLAALAPGLKVDVILLTATHTHEAPDTVGLWGPTLFAGGRYPLYIRYLEKKIAEGVARAAAGLAPVTVTYGKVDPATYPVLTGFQDRMGGRPPFFYDDELRVMALADATTGAGVATIVNWGAHVESYERSASRISSDAVDAMRQTVEAARGGVAIFVPADTGAVVLEVDNPATRGLVGLERTRAIGRVLGEAALAALAGRRPDPTATFLEMRSKDLYLPLTNQSFRLGGILGVIDAPLYLADRWQAGPYLGNSLKTTMYAFRLGQGTFTTVPGELFPEINFDVAEHHRDDIAVTGTGRPFEPSIRATQPGEFKFLIGYTPDLFGYIVPAYDYYIYGLPFVTGVGIGALAGEVAGHYHETPSPSSWLGPAVATTAVELWGGDLSGDPSYKEWLGAKSALLLIPNPFAHLHLDFRNPWVEHR